MNNVKLSFEQMKELIGLFVQNKLSSMKVGDFELSKTHYEVTSSDSTNKTSLQEDPLFFSAPQLPPEIQAMLTSMNQNK